MAFSTIIAIILATIIMVLFIIMICLAIKVVPQSNAYVIERIGKYHATWNSGIHFRFPLIDRILPKKYL